MVCGQAPLEAVDPRWLRLKAFSEGRNRNICSGIHHHYWSDPRSVWLITDHWFRFCFIKPNASKEFLYFENVSHWLSELTDDTDRGDHWRLHLWTHLSSECRWVTLSQGSADLPVGLEPEKIFTSLNVSWSLSLILDQRGGGGAAAVTRDGTIKFLLQTGSESV